MKVTLLPSSVSDPDAQNHYLTSYLVNDCVAIDAGSIGFYGSWRAQQRIKDVFLTHSHIDHLASLPVLLENVYEEGPTCVTIHASEHVLDCLRRDIFNERLWPDFIALSIEDNPFLKLQPLTPGRSVDVAGLRITPVPVNHSVPTLGLIVEDAAAAVVFPSDTGPTEEIWRLANDKPSLRAVFLEATFPNALADLANLSKHLTPALFAAEARKLTRAARLFAVHIKPRFREEVLRELETLDLPNLEIAQIGKTYDF